MTILLSNMEIQLDKEEQLSLLKNEFENVDQKCLEEVSEIFEYEYPMIRDFILELFQEEPNQFRSLPETRVNITITPQLFDSLSFLFSSKNDCLNNHSIRKDLGIETSILLPVKLDLLHQIYQNLMDFLEGDNQDSFTVNGEDNSPPFSMQERMDTEKALFESRKEHVDNLRRLRLMNPNDKALNREWKVEKTRDFLYKYFPGFDPTQLDRIFEMNNYNIYGTLNDLEVIHELYLPTYYKKPSINDDRSPRVIRKSDSSEKSSRYSNLEEFKEDIKAIQEEQEINEKKLKYLKNKKICCIEKQEYDISSYYSQEIVNCYKFTKKLTEEIIEAFQNYGFPENVVDLHGLRMDAVRVIVPSIIKLKRDCLDNKSTIDFRIITGVGTGTIHRYIKQFLSWNKIKHSEDGPGAFIAKLSGQ